MARRSRMSVQKRQREREKAERAAIKREERSQPRDTSEDESSEPAVATESDLEGYGLVPSTDDDAVRGGLT